MDEDQSFFVPFLVCQQIEEESKRFFKDKRVTEQFSFDDPTVVHLRGFRHASYESVRVIYQPCSKFFPGFVQDFPPLFVRIHERNYKNSPYAHGSLLPGDMAFSPITTKDTSAKMSEVREQLASVLQSSGFDPIVQIF